MFKSYVIVKKKENLKNISDLNVKTVNKYAWHEEKEYNENQEDSIETKTKRRETSVKTEHT